MVLILFGEEPAVMPIKEMEAVLRAAMCSPYAGRLSRTAELILTEVCIWYLVEHPMLARMRVVWALGQG